MHRRALQRWHVLLWAWGVPGTCKPWLPGRAQGILAHGGQKMGFQGTRRCRPPRGWGDTVQHLWAAGVGGTVITTSFPRAVPRKSARERRQCAQAGMRAGVGEASQAFQRGQGHSESVRSSSGSLVSAQAYLCVYASAVPKAGRGFLQPNSCPVGSSSPEGRLGCPPLPLLSWPNCRPLPLGPSASAGLLDARCLGLSLPITAHVLLDSLGHHGSSCHGCTTGLHPLAFPRPQTQDRQPPPGLLPMGAPQGAQARLRTDKAHPTSPRAEAASIPDASHAHLD